MIKNITDDIWCEKCKPVKPQRTSLNNITAENCWKTYKHKQDMGYCKASNNNAWKSEAENIRIKALNQTEISLSLCVRTVYDAI